jgi:hypothetical protein
VRAPGEGPCGDDDKQVAAWPDLKGVMTVRPGPGAGLHRGACRAGLHLDMAQRAGAARVVHRIGRARRGRQDDADDLRGGSRWPRSGSAGHVSSAGHGHKDNGRGQQPPEAETYQSHCHRCFDGPPEPPVPSQAGMPQDQRDSSWSILAAVIPITNTMFRPPPPHSIRSLSGSRVTVQPLRRPSQRARSAAAPERWPESAPAPLAIRVPPSRRARAETPSARVTDR